MEEKPTAYLIAVESDEKRIIEEKLFALGDCVELIPGLYLLVTTEPQGKIIFTLDPMRIDSLKRYFVIEPSNAIWNAFDSDKESLIQGLLRSCKK
jgi:hypothetical protein